MMFLFGERQFANDRIDDRTADGLEAKIDHGNAKQQQNEIGDEEIYCAFLGLADHVCDGSFDYGKYHYGQRDVAELDEEICLAELGYVIGVEHCSSRYIEIREEIHAHVTEQCDESREQTDVK